MLSLELPHLDAQVKWFDSQYGHGTLRPRVKLEMGDPFALALYKHLLYNLYNIINSNLCQESNTQITITTY